MVFAGPRWAGGRWAGPLLAVVAIGCPAAAWADDARALSASCAGKVRLGVQVGIYVDEVIFIRPTQFRAIVTRVGRFTDYDAAFRANGSAVVLPVDVGRQQRFWDPELRFSNLDDSREHEVLETRFEVRPTGQVTVTERVVATFRHALDLTLFPYDNQELEIRVAPGVCTEDEVIITTLEEESGVSDFDQGLLHLWRKLGHSISSRTVTHSMAKIVSQSSVMKLSEATLAVRIQRSSRGVVYAYFLPSQLLVVGSWMSFWLAPDQIMPRVVTTWLATLIWMNCQSRLEVYGLSQVMHNTLTSVFTWSINMLLFLTILQNIVIFYVGRTTSAVLAEKFDQACRIMYPAFLAIFWLLMLIALADLDGLRKKTPGEVSSTFDTIEGCFLAIILLTFAVTTAVASSMICNYHRRILQLFQDASSHMMTDAAEVAVLFRYIAGRTEGWVAGRRRAYITVKEIDAALVSNDVPDVIRREVKDTFIKQVRDPAWISQQDFCMIWCNLSQTRYEHFKDPEKANKEYLSPQQQRVERVEFLSQQQPQHQAAWVSPPPVQHQDLQQRPRSPTSEAPQSWDGSLKESIEESGAVTGSSARAPSPGQRMPSPVYRGPPSEVGSTVTPTLQERPPLQPTPRGVARSASPARSVASD